MGAKRTKKEQSGLDAALRLAARDNQARLVEKLLAAGANPCAKNKRGQTALMLAAQRGSREAAMCLAGRSDPEAQCKSRMQAGDYAKESAGRAFGKSAQKQAELRDFAEGLEANLESRRLGMHLGDPQGEAGARQARKPGI